MSAAALIDSNVIIAAVAAAHEHHEASFALLSDGPGPLAVASHSYAESYVVLTNPAPAAPFRWPAEMAWATLERIAAMTSLIGLTHGETFDAVRRFAAERRVGPLLYDRLIGEAAVRNGIRVIVTWNVRHMAPLLPELLVVEPKDERLRAG